MKHPQLDPPKGYRPAVTEKGFRLQRQAIGVERMDGNGNPKLGL
jgi:hypothetical protein